MHSQGGLEYKEMEEKSRLGKHCHVSNSQFDTMTNCQGDKEKGSNEAKSPVKQLSILCQLGCENISGTFTVRKFVNSFLSYFGKF